MSETRSKFDIAPIDEVTEESEKRMALHGRKANTLYLYGSRREADVQIGATRMDGALIGAALAVLTSADSYRVIEAFAAILLLYRLRMLGAAFGKDFGATTKFEMRK